MRKKNIIIGVLAIWLVLNGLNLLILFRAAEGHIQRSAALVSAYVGTAGVTVGFSGPLNLLTKLVNSDDRFVLTSFSSKKKDRPFSAITIEPETGFLLSQRIGSLKFDQNIAGLNSVVGVAVSDRAVIFSFINSLLVLCGLIALVKIKAIVEAKRLQVRIAQERFDVANQVAHDIRSPLSAINLVAASVEKVDSERGELLKRSVKRLDQIAADLLSPQRPVQYTDNFANILSSVIEEQSASAPNISFELNIEANAAIPVSEQVLGRSISNLITNAIEAGAEKVRVSAKRHVDSIEIQVIDSGRGMAQEILERAGRKHFSSKSHGNGLGLSFVKEEIEKVGGKVTIHSSLGQGSEIALLIPLKVI